MCRPGRIENRQVSAALASLSHRGPDAQRVERIYSSQSWDIWFGHARLSILDLSELGTQPMWREFPSGRRGCVTFNGEIYNHCALRSSLRETTEFLSRSDTEVLVNGLLAEGPSFLSKTNSMLALGFWDEASLCLTLARDRLGKKPLFVYQGHDILAFASEIKAFHSLGLLLEPNELGWAYYRWLRYIPWTYTAYRQVSKFPAGCFATLGLSTETMPDLSPQPYWDPFAAFERKFTGNFDEAVDEFQYLLDDSTRLRLDADVPVGIFLSGGIDSSLVAASIARLNSTEATAFIVKSSRVEMDESATASETASALGLPTRVVSLDDSAYRRQVERVAYHYDDPCSSLSQLAVMAMSEQASKTVKVVLTGDGGDEVFLGYPWLCYPDELWRLRRLVDAVPGGSSLARLLLRSKVASWGIHLLCRGLGRNTDNVEGKRQLGLRLLDEEHKCDLYEVYQELVPRAFLPRSDLQRLGSSAMSERVMALNFWYTWPLAKAQATPELLAGWELVTGMRDEILVKVDRATMASSIEARSPLLDYRIVEFGMSLPVSFKTDGRRFKILLREACRRVAGPRLANLKKMGFGIGLPPGLASTSSAPRVWADEFERRWRRQWSK